MPIELRDTSDITGQTSPRRSNAPDSAMLPAPGTGGWNPHAYRRAPDYERTCRPVARRLDRRHQASSGLPHRETSRCRQSCERGFDHWRIDAGSTALAVRRPPKWWRDKSSIRRSYEDWLRAHACRRAGTSLVLPGHQCAVVWRRRCRSASAGSKPSSSCSTRLHCSEGGRGRPAVGRHGHDLLGDCGGHVRGAFVVVEICSAESALPSPMRFWTSSLSSLGLSESANLSASSMFFGALPAMAFFDGLDERWLVEFLRLRVVHLLGVNRLALRDLVVLGWLGGILPRGRFRAEREMRCRDRAFLGRDVLLQRLELRIRAGGARAGRVLRRGVLVGAPCRGRGLMVGCRGVRHGCLVHDLLLCRRLLGGRGQDRPWSSRLDCRPGSARPAASGRAGPTARCRWHAADRGGHGRVANQGASLDHVGRTRVHRGRWAVGVRQRRRGRNCRLRQVDLDGYRHPVIHMHEQEGTRCGPALRASSSRHGTGQPVR
jgi:hypothetical protein